MEFSNELQFDQIASTVVTSGDSITLQNIETLNNNMIMGFLYITGALGIIAGILIGRAFHGVFRGK